MVPRVEEGIDKKTKYIYVTLKVQNEERNKSCIKTSRGSNDKDERRKEA